MSNVVDNRIVEMTFDNDQFEKGVRTSMSTLDNLKQKLNFDNSTKSFEKLSDVSRKVDLSSVGNAVDAVKVRFSALQVIGMTALSNITSAAMKAGQKITSSLINPIIEGGKARAMNIESAKFQLAGLKVAWDDIQEDIDYGVKDTAYGLDSAARVAAQLVASSVTLGTNMKAALRGISGVSAMTNSSYDEIGSIFTTVAGQGKLMTMQLRQLEARGLNAAATLGNVLGKSEAQIREMVTDGKINFQMFADAMDEAFGEHAKDANKTITGVMSNIRSAMSRIGADFISPLVENEGPLVNFFDAIRKQINNARKAISPLAGTVTTIISNIANILTNKIGAMNIQYSIAKTINSIKSILDKFTMGDLARIIQTCIEFSNVIKDIFTPLKQAFSEIFPKQAPMDLTSMLQSLNGFVRGLRLNSEESEKIKSIFRGLFAVLDIGKQAFMALLIPIKTLWTAITGIGGSVFDSAASFGEWLVALDESIKELGTFEKIGYKAADVLTILINCFKNVGAVTDKFLQSGKSLENVVDFILTILRVLATSIIDVFGKITGIDVTEFKKNVITTMYSVKNSVIDFINTVKNGIQGSGIIEIVTSFFESINNAILAFGGVDTSLINEKVDTIKDKFISLDGIGGIVEKIFSGLAITFKNFTRLGGAVVKGIIDLAKSIGTTLMNALQNANFGETSDIFNGAIFAIILDNIRKLIKTLKGLFQTIENVAKGGGSSAISDALTQIKDTLVGFENALNAARLMEIAFAIAILVGSVFLLSGIDPADIGKGITAIGALLYMLTMAGNSLKGIDNYINPIDKVAKALLSLALATLIISSAVKSLGKADLWTLAKGLTGVFVVVEILTQAAKSLSSIEGKMLKGATGLIALGIAVNVLAISVKSLGKMNAWDMIQGLAGIIVVITALVFATEELSSIEGKMLKGAAGLIALGIAVNVLAIAVKSLGALNPYQFMQGLAGIIVLIGTLVIATEHLSSIEGKMLQGATGLIAMALALKIMSSVVESFGGMNTGELVQGMISLAASLGILVVATQQLSKAGPQMILGAAAMLIMSAALAVLVPQIMLLGSMDSNAIAQGIIGLGAALLILVAAGAAAEAVGPGLFILAGALIAVGASVALVGIGVAALGAGLISISAGIASLLALGSGAVVGFFALLGLAIQQIIMIIPNLAEAFAVGLVSFLNVVATYAPQILNAIIEFAIGMVKAISDHLPEIISIAKTILEQMLIVIRECVPLLMSIGGELIMAFLNGIKQYLPQIIEVVGDILVAFIEGLDAQNQKIIEAGKNLIIHYVEGIANSINEVVDAAFKVMIAFINGLAESIEVNTPLLEKALERLFQAGIDAILLILTQLGPNLLDKGTEAVKEFLKSFERVPDDLRKAGADAIKGMIDGVGSKIKELKDKAVEAGKAFLNNLAKTVGWHSPWTTTTEMFEDGAQGAINGVDNRLKDVEKAGQRLGDTMLNGINAPKIKLACMEASGSIKSIAESMDWGQKVVDEYNKRYGDMYDIVGDTTSLDQSKLAVAKLAEETYNAASKAEESSEKAKKSALTVQKAFEDLYTSIRDNIANSLDIFSEFSGGSEITADKMLANMKSQIDGVSNWANNIAILSERGIDDGLLKKLAELGPKSSSYVSAFVNMTGEQLDQANQLYAQSLTLPDSAATSILASYARAGANVVQGVVTGVTETSGQADTAMTNLAQGMQNSFNDNMGIHSPSTVMLEKGKNINEGLINGLTMTKFRVVGTMRLVATESLNAFKQVINYSVMYDLGSNAGRGFVSGLESQMGAARAAAASLGEIVASATAKVLSIHSPSRVMEELGQFATLGLANGIKEYYGRVEEAAEYVGNKSINVMRDTINKIANAIDNDMDVQPTITPVLDLTNLQNGVGMINGIFGEGHTMSMTAGIISARNATASGLNSLGLSGNFNNDDVVRAINDLRGDMSNMARSISNIKMVLNTGTLVGEMITDIDAGLGQQVAMAERGI